MGNRFYIILILFLGIFIVGRLKVMADNDIVYVNDFGAIPNDSQDDGAAIRQAINYAKENSISHIKFGEGTYYLKSTGAYTGIGHIHMCFVEFENLIVEGATNAQGEPATLILRHNPFYKDGRSLSSVFVFYHCKGVTFKNFILDNDPAFCTLGEVMKKGNDFVEVEIAEGCPVLDGSPCYTANAWNLKTRNLKKVPSLTFGSSPAFWNRVDGESDRRLRIEGVDFAKYVDVGDGVSWHLGKEGKQIRFEYCRDLVLENILTRNTAGFAIDCLNCKNIKGNKVVFKTDGKQLSLGSRDAWKLAWCDGTIEVDSMYIEGVRWDGQNIHGPYFYVDEVLSSTKVRMYKVAGLAPILETGSKIGFWEDEEVRMLTIADWNYEGRDGVHQVYTIDLQEGIQPFVKTDAFATLYCLNADSYTLKNSVFKNIAGCAGVLKQDDILVDNCQFDHIMYPALLIGAEKYGDQWYEGSFPRNVTIKNSSFSYSGWVERIGLNGMIGVGYRDTEGKPIRNIHIENNSFKGWRYGVNLQNCDSVYVVNNQFTDVNEPLRSDSSTGYIVENNNTSIASEMPFKGYSQIVSPTLEGYLKYGEANVISDNEELELRSHADKQEKDVVLGYNLEQFNEVDSAFLVMYCDEVLEIDFPETNPIAIAGHIGNDANSSINWNDTILFSSPIDTIKKNQHDSPQWYVWNVTEFINQCKTNNSKEFGFRVFSQSGSNQNYYFHSSETSSELQPRLILYENNNTSHLNLRDKENSVRVFPNPFSNKISIQYQLKEKGRVYLTLYDSKGVVMSRFVEYYDPGLGLKHTWFKNLNVTSGVYFCELKSNEKREIFKLLK